MVLIHKLLRIMMYHFIIVRYFQFKINDKCGNKTVFGKQSEQGSIDIFITS